MCTHWWAECLHVNTQVSQPKHFWGDCCSSVAKSYLTLCDPTDCRRQASLSITICWSLLKFTSIESVMPSNHLILCHLLLLPPSIFPSIRVFSNELALCIRWPKYWSFSFSISSSNEHSGLISFRIDWFNLHAVQGTLKRLLQHYENISSSALSFLYGTTLISVPDYWKTIALTIWTFVGEVTTPLFITLSRFVTAFPPRG